MKQVPRKQQNQRTVVQMARKFTANAVGIYLRKLRTDRMEYQRDMAKKLGITPQYLSGIELGHKKMTDQMYNHLIERYGLDSKEIRELNKALYRSYPEITLRFKQKLTPAQNGVIAAVQEYLVKIGDEDCDSLCKTFEEIAEGDFNHV